MTNTSANNKHDITKNPLLLYCRMFFMMLIALHTSRIILDKLGGSRLWYCNVVGSFVTMFSLINGAMTTATNGEFPLI